MHIPFFRKKKNWALALYCFGLKTAHGPQPTRPSRALPRAQAATWAWAGNSASRARPPGPRRWPAHLAPLNPIGRPSGRFGRSKPQHRSAHRNPSFIRPLPFSLFARRSLFSLPQCSRERPTTSERAVERALAPSPAPSPARVLRNG